MSMNIMHVDIETLSVRLPIVVILGILLFDALLLLYNGKLTISRAIWRKSLAHPWYAAIACGLIMFLVYHLWG